MTYREIIFKILADDEILAFYQESTPDILEQIQDATESELKTTGYDPDGLIGNLVDSIIEGGLELNIITKSELENAT